MKRIEWYSRAVRNLGIRSLARLQFQKRFGSSEQINKLTSKKLAFPIFARPDSSDYLVFDQILVELEYRCLDRLSQLGLIIDCGANVGYSSAYFLSRFPTSYVVAVEPDADNFTMLQKNLTPYRGRYHAVCAAIWPRTEKLQFAQPTQGIGKEWARSVERAGNSTSRLVNTIDLPSILDSSQFDRISILKIDIEGAEIELFDASASGWLDKVDNIVIELHGEAASKAFYDAITPDRFDVTTCGELTVCLRK